MRTRDELAEAILLASVATDPTTERTRMMSPEAAYRQADAFVAERERRTVADAPVDAAVPRIGGCLSRRCRADATHTDVRGKLSAPCCGGDDCCGVPYGWTSAPLADVLPVGRGTL